MIPANPVLAIVGRRFVVELVVTFAKGDKRCEDGVAGALRLRVFMVPDVVSQRVHARCRVVNHDESGHASNPQAPPCVVPARMRDSGRETQRIKRGRQKQVTHGKRRVAYALISEMS